MSSVASSVAAVAAITTAVVQHRGGTSAWQPNLLLPSGISEPELRWQPAASLLSDDSITISDAVDFFRHAHDTDRRVAASQLFKAYAFWLALPTVSGFVARRQALDVGADAVLVAFTDRKPHVRFALAESHVNVVAHRGFRRAAAVAGDAATVVGDVDELRGFLLHRLIDDHLAPMLAAFRQAGGVGSRILAGSLAMALTQPFGPLTTILRRPLQDELAAMTAALGPVGKLVEIATARDARGNVEPRPIRRTCCQKMRMPGSTNCLTCPLLSERRRIERASAKNLTWLDLPGVDAKPLPA